MRVVRDNVIAYNKDNKLNRDVEMIILKNLYKNLKLKNFPFKIEIYDNSHLNGTDAIGAMVVYQNFGFCKKIFIKNLT